MKKWLTVVVAALLLSACGNTKESDTAQLSEKNEEAIVGFEMMGGTIEEATNVPEDEKVKIIAAFDEYIASFNAKDIERYGKILSKNPQGFNYDEEMEFIQSTFENYDVKRLDSDVTIVKYDENVAQVFANIDTQTKDLESNVDYYYSGRQVTVFVKEDDDWKVSSVYYIGNQSDENPHGENE
ncbi:MAG: nuclear transport factor 2 family protein [Lysinibacillus sp.]|nr:nuclear transport factor 2 family protein [Lysinibacillus sp.]